MKPVKHNIVFTDLYWVLSAQPASAETRALLNDFLQYKRYAYKSEK